MTHIPRLVVGAMVILALSLPAPGWAQAVPRGSGGSSGDSGSSGGGSSSGSSGGSSSSPERRQPMRTPAPPRMPSSDGGRVNSRPSGESGGSGGGRTATSRGDRERNDRPAVGAAVPRSGGRPGPGGNGSIYVPSPYVNSWWPDYYGYYGSYRYSYYGYPYYSPFLYGSSRWSWTRYGIWYDPFSPFAYSSLYFDPFYGPFGYGAGYASYPGNFYEEPTPGSSYEVPEATGSIRVRVKPADGKVYLDGTLMGVVDQFDGLTSHLATTAGTHELEIRADGYQPLTLSVDVEPDRTVTARGSLKKQ